MDVAILIVIIILYLITQHNLNTIIENQKMVGTKLEKKLNELEKKIKTGRF